MVNVLLVFGGFCGGFFGLFPSLKTALNRTNLLSDDLSMPLFQRFFPLISILELLYIL